MAGSSRHGLICSVCLDEFIMPKVLPCGHTFCQRCIGRSAEESRRRESDVKCPTCRKRFVLPPTGRADELPTNYELLNIIDEQGRAADRGGPSEPHRSRSRPRPPPECANHDSTKAEFYCTTCCISVCSKCLLDNHKPDHHRITPKADFVKGAMDRLDQLASTYGDVQQQQHDIEVRVLSGLAGCETERAKLERQIETARQNEIKRINADADQMTKRVRTETAERKKTFSQVQRDTSDMRMLAETRKAQIAEVREELNAGNLSNVNDIEDIDSDLDALLSSCEANVDTIQSTPIKMQQFEIQFSYDSIYHFKN